LGLPDEQDVEGCKIPLPYFLVGDDIFALKTWLMRSFPRSKLSENQQIYNYHLSPARRVIENAFGILRARWQIFSHPIKGSVENVIEITKAAICLHNYLRITSSASYCAYGFVDSQDTTGNIKPGEWRSIVANEGSALQNMPQPRGSRFSNSAMKIGDALVDYLVSDAGLPPWQWNHVGSRGEFLSE
jgi:hypothetical protein